MVTPLVGCGHAMTMPLPMGAQALEPETRTQVWNSGTTWQRYCGFLDLSLREYSDIQRELLMEELALAQDTPLGRRLLRGGSPKSVAEFRRTARLTNYGDYLPDLERRTAAEMPEPVQHWVGSKAARSEYKHIPYTSRAYNVVLDNLMAAFILGSASRKGEVNVLGHERVLFNTPPPPALSGLTNMEMVDRFGLRAVLDPLEFQEMDVREGVQESFQRALDAGMDYLVSTSSILVQMGQDFVHQHHSGTFAPSMARPAALARLGKGFVTSKVNNRPLLPKDLWSLKAILAWGIDAPFLKHRVEYFWGTTPYEFYACDEGGIMALQGWNKRGMTLVPYSNFYEFIPEQESIRSWADCQYRPESVLLDQVQEGKSYELVITNFYGMPLLRYRTGHLIRVLSLEDTETGVRLPQIEFVSRCDDRIDLAGFTQIDEQDFWEALGEDQLGCTDWIVRKEHIGDRLQLHLYGEFSACLSEEELAETLEERLKRQEPPYCELQQRQGIHPLRVTRLPDGAFDRYHDLQQGRGLPLAKSRPLRMNASSADVRQLMEQKHGGGGLS